MGSATRMVSTTILLNHFGSSDTEAFEVITQAAIDTDPDTLNLKSGGK